MLPASLLENFTIYQGDALDQSALTKALLDNDCSGIINTAHNKHLRKGLDSDPAHLSQTAAIVAVEAGCIRGKALRACFIGGLGSLAYPGTGGWRIEDYMPLFMTLHHRQTEGILEAIPTSELEWTLLCVAMMYSAEKGGVVQELSEPRGHGLVLATRTPPEWRDSWVRYIPFVGVYLNLVPAIRSYSTTLEDVADMIAGEFEDSRRDELIGQMVGMKKTTKVEAA